MLVGVPKEIENHEYRVGMTPERVQEAVHRSHQVVAETGAGAGINASNPDYLAAGADIAPSAGEVFERAEMIVKVKEPQASERAMLSEGQRSSPICILPPTPIRRGISSREARPASLTRP